MALLTWDTDILGNRWNSNPARQWDSELFYDLASQDVAISEANVYLAQVQDETVLIASNLTDSALFGYIVDVMAESDFTFVESLSYGFIGVWDEGVNGMFPSPDAVCSPLCCNWVEEDAAPGCPGE